MIELSESAKVCLGMRSSLTCSCPRVDAVHGFDEHHPVIRIGKDHQANTVPLAQDMLMIGGYLGLHRVAQHVEKLSLADVLFDAALFGVDADLHITQAGHVVIDVLHYSAPGMRSTRPNHTRSRRRFRHGRPALACRGPLADVGSAAPPDAPSTLPCSCGGIHHSKWSNNWLSDCCGLLIRVRPHVQCCAGSARRRRWGPGRGRFASRLEARSDRSTSCVPDWLSGSRRACLAGNAPADAA